MKNNIHNIGPFRSKISCGSKSKENIKNIFQRWTAGSTFYDQMCAYEGYPHVTTLQSTSEKYFWYFPRICYHRIFLIKWINIVYILTLCVPNKDIFEAIDLIHLFKITFPVNKRTSQTYRFVSVTLFFLFTVAHFNFLNIWKCFWHTI